ncbi:MAG: hypothetical protein ACOCPZ_01655 [Natrialbaceae archaeon]
MSRQYGDIVVFVTLYLLLSLPPFLFLNQAALDVVRSRIAPVDVVTVAVAGTGLFVVLSGLFLADVGVDRYNQFLFAPTDLLSVLVALSFVLAAVAWWLVPELAFEYTSNPSFDLLVFGVIVCQLPMVLFLSLLTVVGKA